LYIFIGSNCNLTARDGRPALISAGAARNAVRLIAAEKKSSNIAALSKVAAVHQNREPGSRHL